MFMEPNSFEPYALEDYPDVTAVAFPEEIHIAFAVCGKQCGNQEFIVDGQTQVCQRCGKLMYRTFVQKFVIDTTVPSNNLPTC